MPLTSGGTIVAPTAGQVLAEVTFPWPRAVRVDLILSASYNFDGLFEVWDADGNIVTDRVVPVLGGTPSIRVVRGGSFVSSAPGARVAKRDSAPPELENESIGLRPVRPLSPAQ